MATQTASEVLERQYLEFRCGLLNLAATLDRIDRADESEQVASDARLAQFQQAFDILKDGQPERAERLQLLFSDPYDPDWDVPRA